jgi:hypothetical protein
VSGNLLKSPFPAEGGGHSKAFALKIQLQHVQDFRLVIHYQDPAGHFDSLSSSYYVIGVVMLEFAVGERSISEWGGLINLKS